MANERLLLDPNGRNALGAISDTTGEVVALEVDNATGRLKVDAAVTVTGLATAISDGDAVNAANDGTMILGTDGSNYQAISVDSSGRLILGASSLAIGKLAANSGVDIGDVDITSIAAGDNNIGNVDIVTVPTDPFGANADAASATGSISAKLRAIATALGVTALDLGSGTGGSRTLRLFQDTAQWVGGTGTDSSAVQRVSLATNVALPAGTNAIGKLSANSGVDIGDVDVTSISAGSNLIGDVGLSGARTSGGTTPYYNLDVDETEDAVKATGGQIYWIQAINRTAAPLYLKFYNATVANTTVGTTAPHLTLTVPANADSDGAGFILPVPNGIAFSTAITIAATTGFADNDTGTPGANDLIVALGYA